MITKRKRDPTECIVAVKKWSRGNFLAAIVPLNEDVELDDCNLYLHKMPWLHTDAQNAWTAAQRCLLTYHPQFVPSYTYEVEHDWRTFSIVPRKS